MFTGGMSQGIINGLQANEQSVQNQDAAEMRRLQMDQLKKAIANQDAQALRDLKINADAQSMSNAKFDDNGVLVPNAPPSQPMPQQTPQQPSPQPPMPGQASVPSQPPPMQQQRPPQPPQSMMNPQSAGQFMQGGGGGQGGGQGGMMPPQQPQQPMQRPAIPPYQSVAQLTAPQPPQQAPQGQPMAPPQAGNPQALMQEAQKGMMTDQEMKDFFAPVLSPTEKKLGELRKAYPGKAPEAYIKALGFDSAKDMREQINKEDAQIQHVRDKKLEDRDKALTRNQAGEEHLTTEKETHRHNTVEEGLQSARLKLEKEKNSSGMGPGNNSGDAAKVQMIIDGVPKSQIVGGYGKTASAEYARLQNMAIGNLMSTGMSASEAGDALSHAQKTYKAEGSTETALTKRTAGVELGVHEIQNDINTLMPILDKFGNNTPKFINTPLNILKTQSSDPGLAQLSLASNLVATKYERALTGGLLSVAQLHTGAAEDAKKILNGDMSIAEMKAKIPLMQTELNNSLKAGKESVDTLKGKKSTDSGKDDPLGIR